MRFDFSIAEKSDDPAIRHLLARNPMPGPVSVTFEREPDYFAGHNVMGDRCVTIKATDRSNGTLAAIASMASMDRFIGGRPTAVGYFGQLRIDHQHRGYMIPLRAAEYVRHLVSDGWPEIWFTAFVDENPDAHRIFASKPRPTLPKMHLISSITTLGLSTRSKYARDEGLIAKRGPIKSDKDTPIVLKGSVPGLKKIVSFLKLIGSTRDFYPVYLEQHFSEPHRAPGFKLDDFLVCMYGGEIVGVCGVWDQSGFKQTVVAGYKGRLATIRPLINFTAPIFGMKKLPAVGSQIASAYLSFVGIRENEARFFLPLLRAAIGEAYQKGKDYLFAGFCDADPLLGIARRFQHLTYKSRMYAFSFSAPDCPLPADANQNPYVEIAAL